jgi:hypothetical protein
VLKAIISRNQPVAEPAAPGHAAPGPVGLPPGLGAAIVAAREAAAAQHGSPEALSADELRRRIRTRLEPDLGGMLEPYPYARRPFRTMGLILCVQLDQRVVELRGWRPAGLSLSLDELFAHGQANTDAEPMGAPDPLDAAGAPGLAMVAGPSRFVASKVANMQALVPAVTGPAPNGLLFVIPRYEGVIYAVVKPGWASMMDNLADVAQVQFHRATPEGASLSLIGYYWAPDGTIDAVFGHVTQGSGKPQLRLDPTPAFTRYVLDRVPPN